MWVNIAARGHKSALGKQINSKREGMKSKTP
jgi:hypothetical protein